MQVVSCPDRVTLFFNEQSLENLYKLVSDKRKNSSCLINPLLKLTIFLDEECLVETELIEK